MNGVLTATLQVKGFRIGNPRRRLFRIGQDPALKGGVQASAALPEPFKVDFARARIIWPKGSPIHWKGYLEDLRATEGEARVARAGLRAAGAEAAGHACRCA